jgi:adenylate cyclase
VLISIGDISCKIKRRVWFTWTFLFLFCYAWGQQNRIDSLEVIYTSGTYAKADQIKILNELAINHTYADRKLYFSELLIETARELDSLDYLFQGLLEKGNALRLKSDLTHALESYFQASKIVSKKNQGLRLGKLYVAIADVYAIMGNHANSVKYHRNAINILRIAHDSLTLASALLNAGDEYITINKWDSALIYTEEADVIFEKIKSQVGEAYSLGNMGMIYAKMGNNKQAEKYMNSAILLLEKLDEYYPISVYLTYIADIYLEKGEYTTALSYALRGLELAKRYGLKEQASDANLKLSKIYEKAGNSNLSLAYYKMHIAYKDSVNNITSVQQMADMRTDFEVSKKQIEVDLLNQQKRNQQLVVVASIIGLIMLGLLAFGLFRRNIFIRKTTKIIEKERQNSETLLLNILPKETAQELKQRGKVKARKFDSVTVLFTDFKGFTQYAEILSPESLVESIDFYFSKFDEIIARYGLEKIKTVGDAYMCAAGLPYPEPDHAYKMVCAAQDIIKFVEETKRTNAIAHPFDVRIGISTGPVVAGVVGTKKFAYDIWGDTVNIAARMEANSEPGKVNLAESTYMLIKDYFDCAYRGEIDVKNKGIMKMYFVNGLIQAIHKVEDMNTRAK